MTKSDASNHTAWMKADGSVATPEQRQLALTVCQGEMEKDPNGGTAGRYQDRS